MPVPRYELAFESQQRGALPDAVREAGPHHRASRIIRSGRLRTSLLISRTRIPSPIVTAEAVSGDKVACGRASLPSRTEVSGYATRSLSFGI
jgi:hypothetical protein